MQELKTLKEIKGRLGLTYDEIGRALGVTSQTVRNWLLYGRKPIPIVLKKIRKYITKINKW